MRRRHGAAVGLPKAPNAGLPASAGIFYAELGTSAPRAGVRSICRRSLKASGCSKRHAELGHAAPEAGRAAPAAMSIWLQFYRVYREVGCCSGNSLERSAITVAASNVTAVGIPGSPGSPKRTKKASNCFRDGKSSKPFLPRDWAIRAECKSSASPAATVISCGPTNGRGVRDTIISSPT
jgi:hypothetical protein